MDTSGLIWTCLLCVCVSAVSGSPIATSTINCNQDVFKALGVVDEEYTGDVELLDGITAGSIVKLVPHVFDNHLDFLVLDFTPGDTSAMVRTKKPLDADGMLAGTDRTLYYSVMCACTEPCAKYNNTRTLKIKDINDNSPIFAQKTYSANVSEIDPVDTVVLRVTAVDADSTPANNRLTYSYEPVSEDFMVTNSGVFMLKRRLNYNLIQKYSFTVKAQDNGGLNDTATVHINVKDFDNLNPYFNHNLYQAFIPENQEGPFRTIQPEAIKAQDGDTGINKSLTYSIKSVAPDKYRRNFHIEANSGVLSVMTAIDREAMNSSMISVSIQAAQTDDILKTAAAVVTVIVEDVNDNVPEFDQSDYSVNLLENSPVDTILFKAVVTDLDQGGFVGTLSILPDSAPFTISSDGTVRVKNSTALDRETTESITFQIEARETDLPNNNALVQVRVTLLDENDNSPVFNRSKYEGKVFANQTVGMPLVQVKAEDPDAGVNGQIKYSIRFGNNDGYFSINEDTGMISLAKTIPLVEKKILEFPLYITATDATLSIKIKVLSLENSKGLCSLRTWLLSTSGNTCFGGISQFLYISKADNPTIIPTSCNCSGGAIPRSSSAQVNIRAPGDSKPQFLEKVFHGTVEEEQDPGVVILKVNFLVLPEVSATLRVVTQADKFHISSSGELTTKIKLDYDEGPHNYSVEISITDGVSTDLAVVKVQVTDVNDNSPVFTSSSVNISVPEDAAVGSNVTTVPATDKDSGFNQEIRYSLKGGEGRFSVDPLSGMVSLAGALDREAKAEYNLQVVAEDQGRPARTSTATLLVQVSDVNDNHPEFSEAEYEVEVLETEPVGTSLLILSAADPDEGRNGRVTYSILQESPSTELAVFEVEPSNGILRLAQVLDYSVVKVYRLIVNATDGGMPSLAGTSRVVVNVKDVNNNPPEFSQDRYDVAVSESLGSGASILRLEVTDRDEGGFSNGYFLYTNNDTFDINQQGVVSLRKDVTLDRETKDSYIIQVVAVDQVTDGLRATAELNITVLDYNDNAPQFLALPHHLTIPEGDYSAENPGSVFTIRTTDADLGPNGEVSLSLNPPSPIFTFREDGTLLAVAALDRESKESYYLVIKATDNGSPQRENITTITVRVGDINDNRPEFSSSSYVTSLLLKDAEVGKLLLKLTAADRDEGNNSLISYSFSSGHSSYLALDSETGAVTLTSDLANVTDDTVLVLTAMAEDHGQPPLNSTARVVVNLRVASLEEGVAFQRSAYNFSLDENQPAGVSVGKVLASSGSQLYSITYTLKTHMDLFSINSSDGSILTRTRLDKEQQDWYILDVEAVDTRIPPTTATTMVRVQVEDVNEAPRFELQVYEASVFSIAPYKTPVINVQASDPDVGDQLVYSLEEAGPYFDVEPSSGLVFVVMAAGLAGDTAEVEVKVTDQGGLTATARVEVEVKGSASSSDVVVISLNQPANVVEKNVPELQKGLGVALGWTVTVIEVSSSSGGAVESRTNRRSSTAVETLVSFIAVEGEKVVSSDKITAKLQSEAAKLREELVKVFGKDVEFHVQEKPQQPTSDQTVVIALGVLTGLSILGLVGMGVGVLIIRFRRKNNKDSDKESLHIGRCDEGYTNTSKDISEKETQQDRKNPSEDREDNNCTSAL